MSRPRPRPPAPPSPAFPPESLDEVRVRLARTMERARNGMAREGVFPTCRGVGCNGCCRGDVQVLPEEVDVIAAALSPEARTRVERTTWEPYTGRCPLVDPVTGGCSVYEVRPLVCRTYQSVSLVDFCFVERVGKASVSRVFPPTVAVLVSEFFQSRGYGEAAEPPILVPALQARLAAEGARVD